MTMVTWHCYTTGSTQSINIGICQVHDGHSNLMSQWNMMYLQLHSNLVKDLICWYDLFISIPTLLGSNQLLTLLPYIMVLPGRKGKKKIQKGMRPWWKYITGMATSNDTLLMDTHTYTFLSHKSMYSSRKRALQDMKSSSLTHCYVPRWWNTPRKPQHKLKMAVRHALQSSSSVTTPWSVFSL